MEIKDKYIRLIYEVVDDKVDAIFGLPADLTIDLEQEQIVEGHVREMLEDIKDLREAKHD